MFRAASTGSAPSGIAVVEKMSVAAEFVDDVSIVEREVGADADVLDADQVCDVFQMLSYRLESGGVGSEEDADTGDADDAGLGLDPEPVGRPYQQRRVAERFGGRQQQQPPGGRG